MLIILSQSNFNIENLNAEQIQQMVDSGQIQEDDAQEALSQWFSG